MLTRTRLFLIATVVMLAIFAANAYANEGTGTAGFCARHGCGEPTDPTTVVECPNVVCPDVTCAATDCSKTTVVVNPTPCPTTPPVTFPDYVPCRKRNDGTLKCPRPRTPRRVLTPVVQ